MLTNISADQAWAAIDSFPGNHSSPALTVHRPCPICGADRARLVVELSDFQWYSDSAKQAKRLDVRHVACRSCFTHYMNPVYTAYGFQILFAEAGRSYGATEGRPGEQVAWLTERGLLEDGSTLLDVGCYEGHFLEVLPEPVRKIGVDIDRIAIERGRERVAGQDIELICGDFESFQTDRRPDAMTMFHVLEHVPDPVAVLAKLRSLAHDDSRLVVEVPIVEQGATNDLVGFFSVQHTTHFSRRSLTSCMRRAGWEPVEFYGADELDYNACRVLAEPRAVALGRDEVEGDPADLDAANATLIAWLRAGRDVGARVRELAGAPRCAIWGGGNHIEFLYQRTALFAGRDRRFTVVDSDPAKQGSTWRGLPINDPSELPALAGDDAPVVISSYGDQAEIAAAAAALGIPGERIIELYDTIRVY